MINDNPFLSATFIATWSKHFIQGQEVLVNPSISPISFVHHHRLPIYGNIGSKMTKGMDYQFGRNKGIFPKNKVLLINDIPTYFDTERGERPKDLGFQKSRQYPGFLIELGGYKDLPHYMCSSFSKASRYKLNKYVRKLETCFEIECKMWYGAMPKDEYENVFIAFRKLLEKRFEDKGIINNNLDEKEWGFYRAVALPMILEKKASLFVIYDSGKPIAVTLNFISKTVIFDAITVFDIDYSKFHLGSITIMKLIEWGILNGYGILDFSKGFFDYKKRWANVTYDFEYHIYYDAKSIKARLSAFVLKKFLDVKQYLREKRLNEHIHKLKYRLQKNQNKNTYGLEYQFISMSGNLDSSNMKIINLENKENSFLKPTVFEFLYLNNEKIKTLNIYRTHEDIFQYIFQCPSKTMGVSILHDNL